MEQGRNPDSPEEALRESVPAGVAERLRAAGMRPRIVRAGELDPETEIILVEKMRRAKAEVVEIWRDRKEWKKKSGEEKEEAEGM